MRATLRNLGRFAGNKWVQIALVSGFTLYVLLRH